MKSEKITKQATDWGASPSRRRYEDACAAAHGMDIVGERWALLVMRELMLGPARFGDLRARLPQLSANVLTQRLEGLEAAGVLHRRRLPPPASAVQVYELTAWGYESEPIFRALGRWAARSPAHDPSLPFSAAALALSLRTMFDPSLSEPGERIAARFLVDSTTLGARIADGEIAVEREAAPSPADLVFRGTARGAAAFVYGGVPMAALEGEGLLALEGDEALARRFAAHFPLPEKAPRPLDGAPEGR